MYQLRTNARVVVRKLFERNGAVFYVDTKTGERNQRDREEFNRKFQRMK